MRLHLQPLPIPYLSLSILALVHACTQLSCMETFCEVDLLSRHAVLRDDDEQIAQHLQAARTSLARMDCSSLSPSPHAISALFDAVTGCAMALAAG